MTFSSFIGVLHRVRVDWAHAVSVTTDGTSSMIGKKAGFVTQFTEKVQTANGGHR